MAFKKDFVTGALCFVANGIVTLVGVRLPGINNFVRLSWQCRSVCSLRQFDAGCRARQSFTYKEILTSTCSEFGQQTHRFMDGQGPPPPASSQEKPLTHISFLKSVKVVV